MNCFEHRQILLNCLSFAGGSQDHAGRRAIVHGPGDTVRIWPHAVGAQHRAWQQELGPAPAVRLRKRDASRTQKYGKDELHPKTKTFQRPSKESSWFSAGPSLFWTSEIPDYQNLCRTTDRWRTKRGHKKDDVLSWPTSPAPGPLSLRRNPLHPSFQLPTSGSALLPAKTGGRSCLARPQGCSGRAGRTPHCAAHRGVRVPAHLRLAWPTALTAPGGASLL